MSEKYFNLEKTKACREEIFFLPSISKWIHVLRKYCSNYIYLKDMYKNVKKLEQFSLYQSSQLSLICEFLSFTGVCTNKKIEIMKP